MNFHNNMPLVQDRSLDLLISSPTRYHCAADTPRENERTRERERERKRDTERERKKGERERERERENWMNAYFMSR